MIADFMSKHALDNHFYAKAETVFVPLAKQILLRLAQNKKPLFVGINGCQGSGKSTLTAFLTDYLKHYHQLNIVNLSLDDFYLSKKARLTLSETVHPLLATRGVPGSHNIELLTQTISALKNNQPIKLSQFNKATDDLLPVEEWPLSPPNVDLVLLEGWCWGVDGQSNAALSTVINDFERQNDHNGQWRHYVNEQLLNHYQPLYKYMDAWLMLQAPSFDCVADWRWQQEQKLALKSNAEGVMSHAQVLTFIQYYQRLTEHSLISLPEKCDWVLTLDQQRNIQQVITKGY